MGSFQVDGDGLSPALDIESKIPEGARYNGFLDIFGLSGISGRAWRVTVLSLLGWLLVNADGSLFNFAYPVIQKELGLSDGAIALIYTIIFLVGAASTFVAGPLMDSIGRKPGAS